MLEKILRYCNRLNPDDSFVREIISGDFAVEDGSIAPLSLTTGQYFMVIGSLFNDGLHKYPGEGLVDETFSGSIWALAIPRELVELSEEMSAWQKKNGAAAAGVYQSESFGAWSGTKATDKNGNVVTVWSTFAARLGRWRKI